ncbi:helix-turn-helix domain-containing protein [Kitasatospora sp. NPDC048286]|uniref:helix-turn-helix domain-containing protein n=1 Tax=unclassified Kitasatospora TaxID=2633591 RepID=UPI003715D80C
MSAGHTRRPGTTRREELRVQAVTLKDSGHTIGQIALNLRISPSTAHRLLSRAARHATATAEDRLDWFTGPDEMLAVLRRAAQECRVVLDPVVRPSEKEAQKLTDALADVLLTEGGFDSEWTITPVGGLVESLIDALHRYAYPDEH